MPAAVSDHDQLLVLADIHAGQLAQSTRLRCTDNSATDAEALHSVARDMKDALVEAKLKPTILLVPGDLTSRGSPFEFQQTKRFIEFVASELQIGMDCVLVTYGNHDVDWDVCRLEKAPGGRRDAYRELASNIGGLLLPGAAPVAKGPVVGSGLFRFGQLEVLMLNSGLRCYALEKESSPFTEFHHGKIDLEQLKWLRSLPSATIANEGTRIALIHHHLVNIPYPSYVPDISLLAEGAEVRKEFGRIGVDILIHGHRHHPHVYTAEETGWAKPTTVICAGSFGVDADHRAAGNIPNTFHVVSLQQRTSKHNRSGILHTFRQMANERWEPISDTEHHVNVDHRQWFGSATGTIVTDAAIDQIVAPLAQHALKDGYADLPVHAGLSLDLRCHRVKALNEAFMKAAQRHGCRMSGSYPGDCLIVRKKGS